MATRDLVTTVGKEVVFIRKCADLSDLYMMRENARLVKLNAADGPKIEVGGFYLKLPKGLGKLLAKMDKFSTVWPQTWGDPHEQVLGL